MDLICQGTLAPIIKRFQKHFIMFYGKSIEFCLRDSLRILEIDISLFSLMKFQS